jgi:hypothetical protein
VIPAFVKRREYSPIMKMHYWVADAPCGMEVIMGESAAIYHWTAPDKIQCRHAMCDMCQLEDHAVQEHVPERAENWFPVLWCNADTGEIPGIREGCDGVNHLLLPWDNGGVEDDCYAWYCGNYPNGWVYWQGDWRCGPCAEKTIFGKRS